MEIILIQHCQSEHHINDLTGGWTDTPLTNLGKNQAEKIADRLMSRENMEEYLLYSSNLLRAKQTADIIGNRIGKDVVEIEGLREINNGIAAGKTKIWANEHRKSTGVDFFDLDYQEYEEGETWRQFYTRISTCMKKLTTSDQSMIIVTHGCALGYIAAWWMAFEMKMLRRTIFSAAPASISILGKSKYDQNMLTVFNDTSHLRR